MKQFIRLYCCLLYFVRIYDVSSRYQLSRDLYVLYLLDASFLQVLLIAMINRKVHDDIMQRCIESSKKEEYLKILFERSFLRVWLRKLRRRAQSVICECNDLSISLNVWITKDMQLNKSTKDQLLFFVCNCRGLTIELRYFCRQFYRYLEENRMTL